MISPNKSIPHLHHGRLLLILEGVLSIMLEEEVGWMSTSSSCCHALDGAFCGSGISFPFLIMNLVECFFLFLSVLSPPPPPLNLIQYAPRFL